MMNRKHALKLAFVTVLTVVGTFFLWRGQASTTLFLAGNAILVLLLARRHRRTAVVFGLLAALVPLTVMSYLLITLQTWYAPSPAWMASEKGGRPTNCSRILPPIPNENVRLSAPDKIPAISAERALQIAAAVRFTINAYGTLGLGYIDGPQLVVAKFPDGKDYQAWYILETSFGQPISGTSVAVYVDAGTGQPLMLIRDIANLGDVQFECGRLTLARNPTHSTLFNLFILEFALLYFMVALLVVEICVLILRR
jgi:hypothetical protein